MCAFSLYNSKIYTASQVPIKYNNRAFRFGDALFETIRGKGHYPLHFHLHYQRMLKAMISLKMDISSLPRQEELHDMIVKLLQKNNMFGSSRVRLEVFRRGEGLYTPVDNRVDFVAEVSALDTKEYKLNEKGLLAGLYLDMKKAYSPVSFFKSANALHYILAALSKSENRTNESLIINEKDRIIEASSSNLFYIKGSVIYTPSVFSGCVDGVMRNVVIDLIKKDAEFVFQETQGVSLQTLLEADEIFITNAIQGIQWIVGLDEKRFFNKITRKLSDTLNREFCR